MWFPLVSMGFQLALVAMGFHGLPTQQLPGVSIYVYTDFHGFPGVSTVWEPGGYLLGLAVKASNFGFFFFFFLAGVELLDLLFFLIVLGEYPREAPIFGFFFFSSAMVVNEIFFSSLFLFFGKVRSGKIPTTSSVPTPVRASGLFSLSLLAIIFESSIPTTAGSRPAGCHLTA